MNYQNNIDAYYAYAKENKKRRKKEERVTWIWLIVSIIILCIVWAYFSNLNPLNLLDTKDIGAKDNLSKVILVDKVDEKSEKEMNSEKILLEKVTQNIPKENSPMSAMKLDKGSDTKITDVNTTDTNTSVEESILMALTKTTDINTSLLKVDGNASVALVKGTDTNASLEDNASKVKMASLDQNKSVDLFHLYIVSKGESIYDIASKQYGDTEMYIKIVNANPDLINPNKIREGQELFLPIINESKSYSDILHFK